MFITNSNYNCNCQVTRYIDTTKVGEASLSSAELSSSKKHKGNSTLPS